jgi:hypothetical protein
MLYDGKYPRVMKSRVACLVILAVSVLNVVPTGAASASVTCSKFVGTLKFNPPLGREPKTLVVSFAQAKLSGCSGSQGASGLLSFKSKPVPKQSCTNLDALALFFTGEETITWSSGHTSTLKTVQLASPGPYIFNGAVTAGALKGRKQKTLLTYKVPTGLKSLCGLKALTHTLQPKATFVIK